MHTDHRVHRQRESDFKNLKIFIDSSQKGAKGPDNSTFILQIWVQIHVYLNIFLNAVMI